MEHEILRPQNFDVYNWTEVLENDTCSGQMECSYNSYIQLYAF